ncbi:MAG: hypothetical protein R3C46_14650 [Hyphomonadaceae bacterium]
MSTTITRPKAKRKPSVRKPGHWRNHWTNEFGSNTVDLGDGTGYGYGKYISAELAEQKAMEFLATHRYPARIYLGPVHFPDGGK